MARTIVIEVSGQPEPWTYYTIYCDAGRHVASRRSPTDLGWPMGRLAGEKDGRRVELVGTVWFGRSLERPPVSLYPCELRVVPPGEAGPGVEHVKVEFEDEPAQQ